VNNVHGSIAVAPATVVSVVVVLGFDAVVVPDELHPTSSNASASTSAALGITTAPTSRSSTRTACTDGATGVMHPGSDPSRRRGICAIGSEFGNASGRISFGRRR
jgi:hypothetical protein